MSTYSNDPQQTKWEIWFITSVILFLSMMFWGTINNTENLPIIYNILLLLTVVNLIHCITTGLKNK
jgi:hypothetical protein